MGQAISPAPDGLVWIFTPHHLQNPPPSTVRLPQAGQNGPVSFPLTAKAAEIVCLVMVPHIGQYWDCSGISFPQFVQKIAMAIP